MIARDIYGVINSILKERVHYDDKYDKASRLVYSLL